MLAAFRKGVIDYNLPPIDMIIRRRQLLTTAIKAITSPDFSFNRVIRIIFVGEEALDVGGPRREFLRYTIFIN